MLVFLDLEANPNIDKIISLGAVCGNREFYSTVHTRNIPKKIKALTGLTNEELRKSPKLDKVLIKFNRWLPNKDFTIIHYGSYDSVLLKKAQDFSGIDTKSLVKSCRDCHVELSIMMFGRRDASMLKILKELKLADEQSHNALSDAKQLKKIFDYFNKMSPDEFARFYYERQVFIKKYENSFENFIKRRKRLVKVADTYELLTERKLILK